MRGTIDAYKPRYFHLPTPSSSLLASAEKTMSIMTWIPSFSTSRLPGWGLPTDLLSLSLNAGTSTMSASLDYHALLTLLRGGTTVSGPSLDVPTPPATIWSFLTAVKLEQGLTDQTMTDRLMIRPPPQRDVKWTRLDEKLEEFMTAWDNGGYEVLKYLCCFSCDLRFCVNNNVQ